MGTGAKRDPLGSYETEILMISKMREILPRAFPCLMEHSKWDRAHPSGISGPQASASRGGHYGGRKNGQIIKAKATDIYLDAFKPNEKRLGDLLFERLVEHRRELGIVFVIWDAEKSTSSGQTRAYPKPPMRCPSGPVWRKRGCLHQNHLHVEFDRAEGDKDHSAALRRIVEDIKLALARPTP